MKISQLRAAALHVLTDHMGIAAEFIIDDVIAALEVDPLLQNHPTMALRQFFAKLDTELPPEINAPAVHLEIMRRALGTS